MDEQYLENVINNFSDAVDKELELQKDINLFADQIAQKLLPELDKEGVIGSFYDKTLSFKFSAEPNKWGRHIFAVRMLDLNHYRNCLKLSIPEKCSIKRAEFEHEDSYRLQDELSKVIVLLLFDHFGFEMGAEAEDE